MVHYSVSQKTEAIPWITQKGHHKTPLEANITTPLQDRNERLMRKIENLPHASEQAADPGGEGTIKHNHVDIKPKAQRRASIQVKRE